MTTSKKQSQPFLLSIFVLFVGLLEGCALNNDERTAQSLTLTEERHLRELWWGTSIMPEGHRGVSLPTGYYDVHKKKRVAVLRFLLGIVKTGDARDAHSATVIALTMEKGPVYGTGAADMRPEWVDRAWGKGTLREQEVRLIETAILAAEQAEWKE